MYSLLPELEYWLEPKPSLHALRFRFMHGDKKCSNIESHMGCWHEGHSEELKVTLISLVYCIPYSYQTQTQLGKRERDKSKSTISEYLRCQCVLVDWAGLEIGRFAGVLSWGSRQVMVNFDHFDHSKVLKWLTKLTISVRYEITRRLLFAWDTACWFRKRIF